MSITARSLCHLGPLVWLLVAAPGSGWAAVQNSYIQVPGPVPAAPQLFRLGLSDFRPAYTENSLGPVEVDRSVGTVAPGDGPRLSVGGRSFRSGFGTRATSLISFELRGVGTSFSAWVGIDDSAPAGGSARFQVIGDGTVLFDSGVRAAGAPPLFTGYLRLAGVQELQLVATDADDGFTGDFANWCNPVLGSTSPTLAVGGQGLLATRGQWGPLLNWPVVPIHAALLPTGEILSYASAQGSGAGNPSPGAPHGFTRVDISSASTFQHFTADHPTEELYGAGMARLADGTLMAVGGFGGRQAAGASATPIGQDQASRFGTPGAEWLPSAPMGRARWGAAPLTLGDGGVVVLGGADASGAPLRPEFFDGASWRTLEGIDQSAYLSVGDPDLDRTYPQAHLAPDGRVFWAGWDERMGMLDPGRGAGAWTFQTVREARQRAFGTSTQLRPDLVLMAGGVDHRGNPQAAASRSSLRCLIGGTTPQTQGAASMLLRRADHNATLLADGTLFVSGGSAAHSDGAPETPWRLPEIYDPESGTWSVAAPAAKARGFRSSALLLPDGRVWTGGGQNGPTAQVFSPPYLFTPGSPGTLAPRPVITSAPDFVAYGQSFAVALGSGAAISSLSFVRLGSSTHGINAEQRFLSLGFQQSGAALTVSAPSRGYDAPPGHYMLFAFDGAGVPSMARIVRIGPPRPNAWQLLTSSDGSTPTARHETAAVTVGGKLYLIGGRGARPTQEFDPVERVWRGIGNPPFEIHHFQPVVLDGLVYVVGAFTGGYPNEQNVTQVYTWDPLTNVWTVVGQVPASRARGSAGTVVYGGKIYLVAGNNQGHNGGARPWFDCFDPQTGTWTVLPDAPRARDHFLAAVVGNRLVLAGGRRTDLPNPFDKTVPEVDVWDFGAGTWSTLADDLPTERAGTMAVAVGRHVVVAGGESNAMTLAHDDVEALDVLAESWTQLPSLVTPRHSGGVGLIQGLLWVASGSGNQGGGAELPTAELIDIEGVLGAQGANLLDGGGFDGGLAGWSRTGTVVLSESFGIASPGALVFAGSLSRIAPVQAGQDYACRALYLGTGAGTANLWLEYLNAGGAVLGQAQAALGAAGTLTSAEILFTVPAGANRVRVTATSAGSRRLVIDDLTISTR